MTLTASEVASLTTKLFWWEIAEYCFTGLVVLACGGEFAASFTNWFTGGEDDKKKLLEKRSTILLVAALSLELVCLVKTNNLSGELIGSISDLAGDATKKAEKALGDSDTAIKQAGIATEKSAAAESTSQKAEDKSGRAENSASNALGLAQGARKEADSFEKDIVVAKTQAADAESHLADALQRATAATLALQQLQGRLADRILTPQQRARLNDALSAIPKFPLFFDSPDGEPLRYGRQFASLFIEWTVDTGGLGITTITHAPEVDRELQLVGKLDLPQLIYGPRSDINNVQALARAFASAGIGVVKMEMTQQADDRIGLYFPLKVR